MRPAHSIIAVLLVAVGASLAVWFWPGTDRPGRREPPAPPPLPLARVDSGPVWLGEQLGIGTNGNPLPPIPSSRPASTTRPGKPGLAVIPFVHLGSVPDGDKDAGRILANLLLGDIDSDEYVLYERSQLVALLAENNLRESDLADRNDIVARVGRLADIHYIVVGELSRLGNTYHLTARAVDCHTAQIHNHGWVSFAAMDDAHRTVPELTSQLRFRRRGAPPLPAGEPPNDIVQAVNPNAPFKVQIATEDGRNEYFDGQNIRFVLKAERDCYITLLSRDSLGNLRLLLPNHWQKQLRVSKGQRVTVPADNAFTFPIQPPHGQTLVRAIATSQPLDLNEVDDRSLAREGYIALTKGVKAIGVAGRRVLDADPVPTLGKLFKESDWATAELTIITSSKDERAPRPPDHVPPAPDDTAPAPVDANDRLLMLFQQINRGPAVLDSDLQPAGGAPPPRPPGLLVFRQSEPTPQGPLRFSASLGRIEFQPVNLPGAKSTRPADLQDLAQRLSSDPTVITAVPNLRLRPFALPDTRYIPVQWALRNRITGGVDTGWHQLPNSILQPQTPPLVGIVDAGLDLTDPRMAALAWVNPGETPGNFRDDDDNGLVDDVNGYNFVNRSGALSDRAASSCHGSMCCAIIAGRSTGRGDDVIGIAPNARIVMAVGLAPAAPAVADPGDLEAVLRAIAYAADCGAKVINLSFGTAVEPADLARINKIPLWQKLEEKGVILVCAAGNDCSDNNRTPVFPASLPRSNIISVLAVDPAGRLGRWKDRAGHWQTFSNYGRTTVHVGAPGTLVLGAADKDQVRLGCGTSYAAAVVTGAAALVLAAHPDWDHRQVIRAIIQTATPCPDLKDRCVSGGMINLPNALAWMPR